MSKARYGLLSGLGQGISQAGSMMFAVAADKEKQKWTEEYQAKIQKEQNDRQDKIIAADNERQDKIISDDNARQDTQRSEDRTNLLADREALHALDKDRYTTETDESGIIWKVDKHTGDRDPLVQPSDRENGMTTAQVSAARAIIETLDDKMANGIELSSQEQERYDGAIDALGFGIGLGYSSDASRGTGGQERSSIDDLVLRNPNPDAETAPEIPDENDPDFRGPPQKYSEANIRPGRGLLDAAGEAAGAVIGFMKTTPDEAILRLESRASMAAPAALASIQEELVEIINSAEASEQTRQRAKDLFDQLNERK